MLSFRSDTIYCFTQPDVASNNSVFNGGNADGFSIYCFAQPDVASNNAVFNGGNADGFSIYCFTQPDVASNNAVFNGGNADGFSIYCFAQPDVASNNGVFNGGNADGFSIYCFAQPDVASNNAVFNGGNADGFAFDFVGAPGVEVPLPIELVSFTGHCDTKNIILKWSTASETNNDFFTLKKSRDAVHWQDIGTVDGAGNSSTILNYAFTDIQSYNEIAYYLLKQTDFNGQVKFSAIISVENCKETLTEILSIYPNPANGKFNLKFYGNTENVQSIVVYNVLSEKVYCSDLYQPIIDLSGQPAGIYFVHFNLTSKIIIEKIVLEKE